ncbi:hypothetical protein IQ227_18330 [Anabaena aphanizomenioides LEGE 00250]|uniref:Uncharacterized protein n=1 Tax=Sphaerospermopsis aphanizomenoides LEGE 00250 TaxID=2777972 RepID=A0ABR9VHG9_9CYAN|nr:hypothetical protein [Sphaerospermopsis aphanizomenoides]MBE9237933.1 hypothetical protein [Sphaerospermopsis aphanizomenoides LEGE 00250]
MVDNIFSCYSKLLHNNTYLKTWLMILWGNGGDRFKLFNFFLTQRRRGAERDAKRDYRLL